MNLPKNAENLFDAVINIVRKFIKDEIQYNYTLIGVVVTNNGDGTYNVKINDDITTVKSLHGVTYIVNDVVYVIVLNKDISKRFILDKVY